MTLLLGSATIVLVASWSRQLVIFYSAKIGIQLPLVLVIYREYPAVIVPPVTKVLIGQVLSLFDDRPGARISIPAGIRSEQISIDIVKETIEVPLILSLFSLGARILLMENIPIYSILFQWMSYV